MVRFERENAESAWAGLGLAESAELATKAWLKGPSEALERVPICSSSLERELVQSEKVIPRKSPAKVLGTRPGASPSMRFRMRTSRVTLSWATTCLKRERRVSKSQCPSWLTSDGGNPRAARYAAVSLVDWPSANVTVCSKWSSETSMGERVMRESWKVITWGGGSLQCSRAPVGMGG